VGFLGVLVSLYTTLNERRREMAILRAVGARPWKIIALLLLEAGLLTTLGCLLGVILDYGALAIARPLLEARVGLWLPLRAPTTVELLYLGAVLVAGFVVGLVPAWRAYRNALADGLSVRL
jgi:putative ABC transport system permease protein